MPVTATPGNPFICTGTGAGTITADHVHVVGVRWIGATANAHTATLTDTAGTGKWTAKAATATLGTDQESVIAFSCLGLKVSALDSGTLHVYTS